MCMVERRQLVGWGGGGGGSQLHAGVVVVVVVYGGVWWWVSRSVLNTAVARLIQLIGIVQTR